MPGIIPMKLIKCGSSQTRIAQACDRCRSKKIRCDGVRPCCSQCANVGFECKTSDKLSRRAFPRGYTESLEERVRCLEREVRELKDLLDAKDEQLDMLSRIHSFSSPYSPPASATSGSASHRTKKSPESVGGRSQSVEEGLDETIVVGEPALLVRAGAPMDRVYMGASSGKPFLDLVRNKMAEQCRYSVDLESERFFEGLPQPENNSPAHPEPVRAPPRMLADHLIVSYFQEFHPLFPVLHRPTLVASYERLVSGNSAFMEALPKHTVAQLFLIFSITLLQNEPKNTEHQRFFTQQWKQALDAVMMESSLATVQCLVLAQLYCFASGDYARLPQYKALAVGMVLRLGLNHSQRKFQLGALVGEMRKRTFWCAYTLDTFSAAMLGLPKLLKEEDVEAEYPSDIDDEYVSEEGFLPTLPGDSTKISSALGLFRGSRVLTNVLNTIYPGAAGHELSYAKMKDLEDELDAWKNGLAPHLRLEFVNGAPATNLVGSRSPLLVLSYHYTKLLIHLPILSSSHLHHASTSSLLARDSAKCITQIVSLLSERKLGFAFCFSKTQLLILTGFVLLNATLDARKDGALAKENTSLISTVVDQLSSCTIAPELEERFRNVAAAVLNGQQQQQQLSPPTSQPQQQQRTPPRPFPLQLPSQPAHNHHVQQQRRLSSTHSGKLAGRPRSNSHNNDFRSLASSSMTNLSPRSRQIALHFPSQPTHKPTPSLGTQSRHASLSSYDAPDLGFLWEGREDRNHSGGGGGEGDWERALAMMDATHAAHIYGDGSGGELPESVSQTRHHSLADDPMHVRRWNGEGSGRQTQPPSQSQSQEVDMPFVSAAPGGETMVGEFLAPIMQVDVGAGVGGIAVGQQGGWYQS